MKVMTNELRKTLQVILLIPAVLGVLSDIAVSTLICRHFQRCLAAAPPKFRRQRPGLAWLLLIPFFDTIWLFFIAPPLSRSYQACFAGLKRSDVGDCGYTISLGACILQALSLGLWAALIPAVLILPPSETWLFTGIDLAFFITAIMVAGVASILYILMLIRNKQLRRLIASVYPPMSAMELPSISAAAARVGEAPPLSGRMKGIPRSTDPPPVPDHGASATPPPPPYSRSVAVPPPPPRRSPPPWPATAANTFSTLPQQVITRPAVGGFSGGELSRRIYFLIVAGLALLALFLPAFFIHYRVPAHTLHIHIGGIAGPFSNTTIKPSDTIKAIHKINEGIVDKSATTAFPRLVYGFQDWLVGILPFIFGLFGLAVAIVEISLQGVRGMRHWFKWLHLTVYAILAMVLLVGMAIRLADPVTLFHVGTYLATLPASALPAHHTGAEMSAIIQYIDTVGAWIMNAAVIIPLTPVVVFACSIPALIMAIRISNME